MFFLRGLVGLRRLRDVRPGLSKTAIGQLLVITLLLTLTEASLAGEILFGSQGTSGSAPSLFTIDQTTAAETTIGPITAGTGDRFPGLTFDTLGVLYGTDLNTPGNPGSFYRIDPNTGAGTFIGPTNLSGVNARVRDLAAQPGTGTLFGVAFIPVPNSLVTINKATGALTLIGLLGGADPVRAIAFAPDGTLYGVGSANLYTINPLNGSVLTTVALSGVDRAPDGLAVRPSDGLLFLTLGSAGSDALYRIVPATGVGTLVGPLGLSIGDLAFQQASVPFPPSLLLFVLGVAVVVLGAQRQEKIDPLR